MPDHVYELAWVSNGHGGGHWTAICTECSWAFDATDWDDAEAEAESHLAEMVVLQGPE